MRDGVKIALALFGKQADVLPMIPQIAMPAIGGYIGKRLGTGSKLGPELGALMGSITGGVGGAVAREALDKPKMQQDTTIQDIPPWAVSMLPVMQQALKQGEAHESNMDMLGGDVLGAPYHLGKGAINGDMHQGVRNAIGQTAGTVVGGGAGHLAGMGLSHLLGRDVNVPLANIPLSTLLSGLGATVGSAKGLNWAAGKG